MSTWELLHDLRESEQEQTVIKIKVKGIDKPIVAAVDRITSTTVVLKPLTLFGERLETTTIPLIHIEKLVKFHLRYQQGIFPVMKRDSSGVANIEVKSTRTIKRPASRRGISR